MNRQREKVLPVLYRFGSRDSAQHNRFAQGRHHGAVGLTGNLARFERQGLSAPLDGYSFRIKH